MKVLLEAVKTRFEANVADSNAMRVKIPGGVNLKVAPKGTAEPLVTMNIISTSQNDVMKPTNTKRPTVMLQLSVFAKREQSLLHQEACDLLREVYDKEDLTISGYRIIRADRVDDRDVEDSDGGYHQAITYSYQLERT